MTSWTTADAAADAVDAPRVPSSTSADIAPDAADAPRVLGLRSVHRGWGRFGTARLRLADGTGVEREVEDPGDAVAVQPYGPERREALSVRQFRPPAFVRAALPLDGLARRADAGALADMRAMLLVLALRHRRPDPFTP